MKHNHNSLLDQVSSGSKDFPDPSLGEISARDKVWDKHKLYLLKISDYYKSSEEFRRYSERMNSCANLLDFLLLPDKDCGGLRLKLKKAQFCRVSQCPVCQWRKSLIWKFRMYQVLPSLHEQYPDSRFIFLTLTVRNCDISDLRNTINHMNKSWQRLTQKKAFPAIGWLKTLEVTSGKEKVGKTEQLRTDRAHPHFHCLVMVKRTYFKDRGYLNTDKWVSMWRHSLRVDYDPSIKVKSLSSQKSPLLLVPEIVKYCTKSSDKVRDKEWFFELTRQLQNKRTISTGGILRDFLKDLENEPEDLIGHDDTNVEEEINEGHIYFTWRQKDKMYRMRAF